MKLKVGDKLVCIKVLGGLVYGETYIITNTRFQDEQDDICIYVDGPWWFGQVGSTEPWTNWFVLEKQWSRNKKLEELGL